MATRPPKPSTRPTCWTPRGNPYDASKTGYTLTFEDGGLPPVTAFWSLTMYDGKTQLFVPNPLERYLLNSTTMDDYVFQDDGSLVLYIGKESPGEALEANWLPAPDGPFYLVLRLYGPGGESPRRRMDAAEPDPNSTIKDAFMKRLIVPVVLLTASAAFAAEPVTVDTFVRAESDHMICATMAMMGVDFGKLMHLREPTTPEDQPVIRMKQDTLYSSTVRDLSKPVKITLPEADGRYMSMHVVNQDHYMFVESEPVSYELTEDNVGTRFALVTIRTFAAVTDLADIAEAHAIQDAIELSGGGGGPFDAPDWSTEDLAVARRALHQRAVVARWCSSVLLPTPETLECRLTQYW